MEILKIGWITNSLAEELIARYGIDNVEDNLHKIDQKDISNYNLLKDKFLKYKLDKILRSDVLGENNRNILDYNHYSLEDSNNFKLNYSVMEHFKKSFEKVNNDMDDRTDVIKGVWYNEHINTLFFIYNEETLSLRMRRLKIDLERSIKYALNKVTKDVIVPRWLLSIQVKKYFI